jgi:hypothetical protein
MVYFVLVSGMGRMGGAMARSGEEWAVLVMIMVIGADCVLWLIDAKVAGLWAGVEEIVYRALDETK